MISFVAAVESVVVCPRVRQQKVPLRSPVQLGARLGVQLGWAGSEATLVEDLVLNFNDQILISLSNCRGAATIGSTTTGS